MKTLIKPGSISYLFHYINGIIFGLKKQQNKKTKTRKKPKQQQQQKPTY